VQKYKNYFFSIGFRYKISLCSGIFNFTGIPDDKLQGLKGSASKI